MLIKFQPNLNKMGISVVNKTKTIIRLFPLETEIITIHINGQQFLIRK